MRQRLQHAIVTTRWWLLALLTTGFVIGIAAYQLKPPPQGAPEYATPVAAVTAPEPTAVATTAPEPTAQPTPQPDSFAGISTPPPQPPPRTTPVHHTVTEGQVLWQIAEQYNLRPETILWANDISDPDLLLIGQDLLIPPTDGVLYTVKSGDALADVANRYGVDLQAIVTSNQLQDANQIQAGNDIFLPGGRPLIAAAPAVDVTADQPQDDQAEAASGVAIALPPNIDVLLAAGWLTTLQETNLYKLASAKSATLHSLPAGARLERLSGFSSRRIQVRDPGDGHTRQAMTGWVDVLDLDPGRAPATRELPQAYPADTAMDIFHVFAPYRSQLDGSPFAEANCGPTAVGMALDAFGVSATPRQLRNEALAAQHMFGNGVGTLITALAQVVDDHGLTPVGLRDDDGSLHRWSPDDIRAQVQLGRPVIVQVRYRSLPGRGGAYYFGDHYILVTGVVGDGFLYNDPIDIDGLGWDRVISAATLRNAMNASASLYAYTAVAVGR